MMVRRGGAAIVAILIMSAPAACSAGSNAPTALSSSAAPTGVSLTGSIAEANAEAAESGYSLHRLTEEEFLRWFDEAKLHELLPDERARVSASIDQGYFPASTPESSPTRSASVDPLCPECDSNPVEIGTPDYGLELSQGEGADTSPSIVVTPFDIPIVTEDGYLGYTDYLRGLLGPDQDLATEPFRPSATEQGPLDESVEVRITEVRVAGEPKAPPAERDALKVEIRLTPESLDDAADYFGTGFDRKSIERALTTQLGTAQEAWVNLADVIPNWVGEHVNTFPQGRDTDVCFGAAREFYYSTQDQRHNSSTEASSLLLDAHYCLLDEGDQPRFGDYLSVPNLHAGRYILRDPQTGRDVSFSVQSGGNTPYRFYWADEDFSAEPFAGTPDPDVFKSRIDVWRHCR